MAFKTQVYYGYKIENNLADVINSNEALQTIGLNVGDLDIIRGSSDSGILRDDLIAVSGLDREVYRTLDRYIGDTEEYRNILTNSAGADKVLFGNINVNGAIGGSGIRYKYLNDNNELKIADISTSRTSAWSTATGNPTDSDPIFYGNQIQVSSGGKISVDQIQWGQRAEPREFDAEVATHKITTTINDQVVKLYAMKSIPLKLEGYFSNFTGTVRINQVNDLKVSWKITNQINSSDVQKYANFGNTSESTLRYGSVTGAPRAIEVYYPPDNITGLFFRFIGLKELPPASLTNLNDLNVSFNEIDTIPNINIFAPNLQSLDISRNNLTFSPDKTLRKLGVEAVSRLPSSLRSLTAYSTFSGSIRCVQTDTSGEPILDSGNNFVEGSPGGKSVIEARFPNLVTLNFGRPNTEDIPFFAPDSYDSLAFLPSVSNTCQNYNCNYNDFRRVPSSGVKNLTNLRNLNLYSNYNLVDTGTFGVDSDVIETINIGRTILPIPDLGNRLQLTRFSYRYNRNKNPLFAGTPGSFTDGGYKFRSCTSLNTLDLYESNVEGFIPRFSGNNSLQRIEMYNCDSITGGRPDNGFHGYANGKTYIMYNDTFADTPDLRFFRVRSRSLLEGVGFEENTFNGLRRLDFLYWMSYRRTGRGGNVQLPNISGCQSLRHLIMPVNDFTGSIPSMVSNDRIYYIHLAHNKLGGQIPSFTSRLNLAFVFLYDNNLTSFPGFVNLPRLQTAYLHQNQIEGAIPNFSGETPNLKRLYLYNNRFDFYTKGSFVELTRLQKLDISRNDLSTSDLNNIITDLYENYLLAQRGNVSINLRSQSNAQGYNPSSSGPATEQAVKEKIDALRNAGWTINL